MAAGGREQEKRPGPGRTDCVWNAETEGEKMNQMYEQQEIIQHLKAENEHLRVLAKGYEAMYRQAKAELEALKKEAGR